MFEDKLLSGYLEVFKKGLLRKIYGGVLERPEKKIWTCSRTG
jgi:hypothetical protein